MFYEKLLIYTSYNITKRIQL